jgi:hypothetical protein
MSRWGKRSEKTGNTKIMENSITAAKRVEMRRSQQMSLPGGTVRACPHESAIIRESTGSSSPPGGIAGACNTG